MSLDTKQFLIQNVIILFLKIRNCSCISFEFNYGRNPQLPYFSIKYNNIIGQSNRLKSKNVLYS